MKVDKVTAIYDATIELITTKGFHATSMANIIKEAGVGAGTLYHYFESKEVLINKLIIKIKKEMAQEVMKNVDLTQGVEHNFEKMWSAIWDYTFNNPQKAYFAEMFIGSALISQTTLEEIYVLFADSMMFVEDAMQKNIMQTISLQAIESYVFGPIYHLLKLVRLGSVQTPHQYKEEMYQLCWKAIKG